MTFLPCRTTLCVTKQPLAAECGVASLPAAEQALRCTTGVRGAGFDQHCWLLQSGQSAAHGAQPSTPHRLDIRACLQVAQQAGSEAVMGMCGHVQHVSWPPCQAQLCATKPPSPQQSQTTARHKVCAHRWPSRWEWRQRWARLGGGKRFPQLPVRLPPAAALQVGSRPDLCLAH